MRDDEGGDVAPPSQNPRASVPPNSICKPCKVSVGPIKNSSRIGGKKLGTTDLASSSSEIIQEDGMSQSGLVQRDDVSFPSCDSGRDVVIVSKKVASSVKGLSGRVGEYDDAQPSQKSRISVPPVKKKIIVRKVASSEKGLTVHYGEEDEDAPPSQKPRISVPPMSRTSKRSTPSKVSTSKRSTPSKKAASASGPKRNTPSKSSAYVCV